ncbi:MAG: MarR family transcriptional regulator [Thermomicrobiales bacterium]
MTRSNHPIANEALGTRLRALLDRMDADIAALDRALGLDTVDFRPRFSPVMRMLADGQALSVRVIASGIGVTHSAASQTVAHMERRGLVEREAGMDGRERRVRLSALGESLLPVIEREWRLTRAAVDDLDRELPVPLAQMIDALEVALARRPLAERFPEGDGIP